MSANEVFKRGPFQRLEEAAAKLENARAGGIDFDSAIGKDLVHELAVSQKLVQRLQDVNSHGIRKALGNASRVPTSGGGAVNAGLSVIGALGPEGKAAEIVLAAGIALAGALFETEKRVAEISKEYAQLRLSTLSTQSEAGKLGALGAAGGFNAGSLANQLRDRSLSDPYAHAEAQRFGASFLPGPYQQDTGAAFLQVISEIRKLTKEEQALALKRTGLEGAEALTRMSDSQFQRTVRTGAISGAVQTPELQQSAADFQAGLANVSTAASNLLTSLSGPAMKDITDLCNEIADFFNMAAQFASEHQGLIRGITGVVEMQIGALTGNLALMKKGLDNAIQGGLQEGGGKPGAMPEDPHTRAVDRLTDATMRLVRSNEQTERSRSALGAGVNNPALIHQMAQLGAFPSGNL